MLSSHKYGQVYSFEKLIAQNPFFYPHSKATPLETNIMQHSPPSSKFVPSTSSTNYSDEIIPNIHRKDSETHPRIIELAIKTLQKPSIDSLQIFSDLEDMAVSMNQALIEQLLNITSIFTLREITGLSQEPLLGVKDYPFKKKILALDLDETLIYCSPTMDTHYESDPNIFLVRVFKKDLFFAKRPGLDLFLEDVSKVYDVVV